MRKRKGSRGGTEEHGVYEEDGDRRNGREIGEERENMCDVRRDMIGERT